MKRDLKGDKKNNNMAKKTKKTLEDYIFWVLFGAFVGSLFLSRNGAIIGAIVGFIYISGVGRK